MSETTFFRQVCSWLGPPLCFKYTHIPPWKGFKILKKIKLKLLIKSKTKLLKTLNDIQQKSYKFELRHQYVLETIKSSPTWKTWKTIKPKIRLLGSCNQKYSYLETDDLE